MDRELTRIGPPLERCLASSFAKHATRGARPACESDIEDVPGLRVWLRRTSREADSVERCLACEAEGVRGERARGRNGE